MQAILIAALTSLLLATVPTQESQPAARPAALKGLDPVRLTQGEEVAGRADLSAQSGQYLYHFASEATRATFVKDPARYEIQFGGGCGRMGPLSGTGDDDRFAVYRERIYIFASDQCRDSFLKRGELFLDPDEPSVEPTPAEAMRGRILLDRAIAAHGGAERLRAMKTYRHEHAVTKGDTTEEHRLQIHFPDQMRIDHDWLQGEKVWRFARIVVPNRAFFLNGDEVQEMHTSAQREFRRDLLHEPLFALRTALARAVVVAGTEDRLTVWVDGCLTTFGLDADGRVHTATYRGRGPQLWFGKVERVFDGFADMGGIVVPSTVTTNFDGAPAKARDEQRTKIAIDSELPANVFADKR